MSVAKLIAMMGGASAQFIGEHHYSPSASPQSVSFAGASAGNLAIIIASNSIGSSVTTPSGWTSLGSYTWVTFGYTETVLYKVLSAGDISTGSVNLSPMASDGLVMALFYSGATAASVRSTGDAQTSSVTAAGFSQTAGCKGIITYCVSRAAPATPVAPAFTKNRVATFDGANGPHFSGRVDDVRPSGYGSGANITYTSCGTTEAIVRAIELT